MNYLSVLDDPSVSAVEHPGTKQPSAGTADEKTGQSLSTKKEHRLSINSTTTLPEITQDDKRLLLRIKWILSNIFPDVRPFNRMDDEKKLTASAPVNPASSDASTIAEGGDSDHEIDKEKELEEEREATKYPHMTKEQRKVEKKVQNILKDPAEGAEMSFIMSMLAFLKDGTTKSFSQKENRAWAKVLLKSVGRDTDIINILLPDEEDDVMNIDNSRRKTTIQNSSEVSDMDDWRSVLVHLQTFYPVGKVGCVANVEYEDDKNMASRGVLSRIRTMRNELKDVVKYKLEKANRSKTGKSIATNLTVSGIFCIF